MSAARLLDDPTSVASIGYPSASKLLGHVLGRHDIVVDQQLQDVAERPVGVARRPAGRAQVVELEEPRRSLAPDHPALVGSQVGHLVVALVDLLAHVGQHE